MTVVELSQIELENPPPFKSAARYLTSCFTRYLKCAYHHAKQPQCTVCVTQRWNRPVNMIQMLVVYDHVLTFRAAGDGGGVEFEATRLTIQWPHFKSAFKNVGRRHHWIFVKRPVGSVQPLLRWHNTVFSKDLEVSRPIFGSGASKTRSFQETLGISSCVSGDQILHFKRKHFGFLTSNKYVMCLSRNQSTSKVLWWEKS